MRSQAYRSPPWAHYVIIYITYHDSAQGGRYDKKIANFIKLF